MQMISFAKFAASEAGAARKVLILELSERTSGGRRLIKSGH